MSCIVRRVRSDDRSEWLRLRTALWPHCPLEEHRLEMDDWARGPETAVLVAERVDGGLCGFLEAAIRPCNFDGAIGQIGYVEGWFVEPDARRKGIGRQLLAAAEDWARTRGCVEIHSDTETDNATSQAAHARVGFVEVARLVHFCKRLQPSRLITQ